MISRANAIFAYFCFFTIFLNHAHRAVYLRNENRTFNFFYEFFKEIFVLNRVHTTYFNRRVLKFIKGQNTWKGIVIAIVSIVYFSQALRLSGVPKCVVVSQILTYKNSFQ